MYSQGRCLPVPANRYKASSARYGAASGKPKWESLTETELFLKIDPPFWKSCFLEELDSLTDDYKKKLDKLAKAADACKIEYFNHPSAIAELLDKRACKKKLKQNGLPVTESLEAAEEEAPNRLSVETLLEMMERCGIHQVFIKPVNGSGAAGVSAFPVLPRNSFSKAAGQFLETIPFLSNFPTAFPNHSNRQSK